MHQGGTTASRDRHSPGTRAGRQCGTLHTAAELTLSKPLLIAPLLEMSLRAARLAALDSSMSAMIARARCERREQRAERESSAASGTPTELVALVEAVAHKLTVARQAGKRGVPSVYL